MEQLNDKTRKKERKGLKKSLSLPTLLRTPSENNGTFIEIADLATVKKLLLPLSANQKYHVGPIFQAIMKYLKENNVPVTVLFTTGVHAYNLQVEWDEPSPTTPLITTMIKKMEQAWESANLGPAHDRHSFIKEMLQEGTFAYFHWDSFKEQNAEAFEENFYVVEDAYLMSNPSFRKSLDEIVEQIIKKYITDKDAKYASNSIVLNILQTKGLDHVREIYLRYLLLECAMIRMLALSGEFDAMAYPFSFYQEAPDKKTTSQLIFEAALSLIPGETAFKLLDIKITSEKSQSTHSKKTNDTAKEKETAYINKLKLQIRSLQTKQAAAHQNSKPTNTRLAPLSESIAKCFLDSLTFQYMPPLSLRHTYQILKSFLETHFLNQYLFLEDLLSETIDIKDEQLFESTLVNRLEAILSEERMFQSLLVHRVELLAQSVNEQAQKIAGLKERVSYKESPFSQPDSYFPLDELKHLLQKLYDTQKMIVEDEYLSKIKPNLKRLKERMDKKCGEVFDINRTKTQQLLGTLTTDYKTYAFLEKEMNELQVLLRFSYHRKSSDCSVPSVNPGAVLAGFFASDLAPNSLLPQKLPQTGKSTHETDDNLFRSAP